MNGLPSDIYRRCRDVLAKCAEFESNTLLRSVFVTEELAPFKGGVQNAASKNDRIDLCLEFLLSKQLRDGRQAFHVFLETLRDRYRQGDMLHDELDRLAQDVLSPPQAESPAGSPGFPALGNGEIAGNQTIIRIKANDKGQYFGNITHSGRSHDLGMLGIGSKDVVVIKGEKHELGNLTEIAAIPFGESGRLAVGQYLYKQVCGKISGFEGASHIRIVTSDEHTGLLPWILMAGETGMFLTIAGCAISLAVHEKWSSEKMPAHPKILVAAPKPAGWPDTGADRHVADKLMGMLTGAAGHRYYLGNLLRTAETWDEFQNMTENFRPDAIYFYGHGKHVDGQTFLIFTQGRPQRAHPVSASDFAGFFRRLPEKMPPVVYINCLEGDTGGMFGLARQLAVTGVPAALANRDPLKPETAREMGLAFWRRILLDGQVPDEAAQNMRDDMGSIGLAGETRWSVPVPYCQYGEWESHPPQRFTVIHDRDWSLKLDRVNQISKVSYLTRLMLKERTPKIIVYLWCGEEGQGVDLFHERLKVELRDELERACFMEIQPEWPVQMIDPNKSYEEMMLEAFEVDTMNHIPACIRSSSQGRSNRQTLVYIRHAPLRSVEIMNLRRLKEYLEWLNTYFATLLDRDSHAMFGISYVMKDHAEKFHKMAEKRVVEQLALSRTAVHLLDEMGAVVKRDLHEFIKTHNIVLPPGRIDAIFENVLEKTKGKYEITLDELRLAIDRPYEVPPDEEEVEMDEAAFFK